jgi:hypothetical protein
MIKSSFYTLEFFHREVVNGIKYSLPNEIIKIIDDLNKVTTDNIPVIESTYPKKNMVTIRDRGDRGEPIEKERYVKKPQKNKYSNTKTTNMSDDWKTVQTFKATKLEVKVGTEKLVNDIRIALNKLSNKNIETMKVVISELIKQILEETDNDHETQEQEMNTVSQVIFDIASSNKFYAELYAGLYADLMKDYHILSLKLSDLVDNYKTSILNIKAVDPNQDYDGYCNYTKTNDLRKAMVSFIVFLMKKGVFEKEKVVDILVYLQELVLKYAEENGRTNEIEEIIENIYLLMTLGKDELSKTRVWTETVIPNIQNLSKLRKTDLARYVSMSNRAVFKLMDVLDSCK